ncbi:DUF4760 domain-containing protein [Pseudomonas capsici]|uniref:DUF4760 domain-containing protein n=1 Tax=Pseudomonas capsici TaxID=2810614 RepID=UPI0021F1506A|nr:DUF4760 domain-containing protein [Pseudomonas capsici]MCV4285107.1 DUF4760 domain-containing protein [Pseudomonas capsici]
MDPVALEQPLKVLGETIGFWVQTAVILLGAGAAVVTIIINGRLSRQTIEHNEKLSRQRATIDLLLNQRTDSHLIDAKREVGKIHRNGGDFTALAVKDRAQDPERSHILAIINNYEFIALGIREGALDEGIYKRAVYSQLMRDWKAMKAFVMELRRQNQIDTLFQELELLAKRWGQNVLECDS